MSRNIMKIAVIALSYVLLAVAPSRGDSIGINFASARPGAGVNNVGIQTAGVVPQGNWNDLAGASGAVNDLIDDAGGATTASITWNAGGGTWDTGITANTGDTSLMRNHLDARSLGDATVTVSNIPASISQNPYDVYVYFDAETHTGLVTAGYTIGDQTFWTRDTGTFDGTFAQTTFTTKAAVQAAVPAAVNQSLFTNYARFTGVTGDSFDMTADSDTFRAEVSGLQIVGGGVIPEPGSAILAMIGFAWLLFFGSRWRRRVARDD